MSTSSLAAPVVPRTVKEGVSPAGSGTAGATSSLTPAASSPSRSRASTRTLVSPLAAAMGGSLAAASPLAPAEDLYGPYVLTVSMALAQGGSVLLVGPTGTGKSALILDAAIKLGWGVELIVCHEGKRIHMLQGGHSREVEKGEDWRFASGPITRLARRVQRGERVMLILDELARAHKEVFAYVMDLLNTYSTREVQAMMGAARAEGPLEDEMRMELPSDFGRDPTERYHILAVDVLQRRFVISVRQLQICATANQGEAYGGVDFSDPAFVRRWMHWLHLAGYDPGVMRQILASKCGLPSTANLFSAILTVATEVHAYHMKEDALKQTLSLPLLINWAKQTQWYFTDPRSRARSNLRLAFETAARTAWLDRVCPYEGGELEKEVEKKLLGFVSGATLSRIS
jgi:hypothetical protein